MLSSRYLYLHQALGMGVMWLKQGAYIVTPSESPMANTPTVLNTTAKERVQAWQAMLPENLQDSPKKILKKPERTEKINPEIQELLSCGVYCVSGSVLWLSLSDKLDLSPDDALLHGEYGKLLIQLMASIGCLEPTWQAFNIPQFNDWQEKIISLIQNNNIQSIIFLGEYYQNNTEFVKQLQKTNQLANCIYLPHPAKLLRQPILKKSAWIKIKILIQ